MKALILVSSRKKRESYLEPLLLTRSELETAQYEVGSIEELEFVISEDSTEIYNQTGSPLSDFGLIVFRLVGRRKREAVAVARYCETKGIRTIDSTISTIASVDDENKLAEMLVLAMSGISVPLTAYSSGGHLDLGLGKIGFPAVYKAMDGKKGRSNYLIRDYVEYESRRRDNAGTGMLLQQYIPNDRDYRVLVLNYDKVVVTERKRKDNSTHLNNVSTGGDELLIDDYTGVEDVIQLSIRAAKTLSIEVAGVDVVVNKNTGKPYVMEVNRAPELTLEAELSAYFTMLRDVLAKR
jgi:glutathione synthase/RimK-type ligase-like ATP-grasp enzyme